MPRYGFDLLAVEVNAESMGRASVFHPPNGIVRLDGLSWRSQHTAHLIGRHSLLDVLELNGRSRLDSRLCCLTGRDAAGEKCDEAEVYPRNGHGIAGELERSGDSKGADQTAQSAG